MEDRNKPEFNGPYSTGNGVCGYGHPVNGWGRCEPINMEPPQCPPEEGDSE